MNRYDDHWIMLSRKYVPAHFSDKHSSKFGVVE